MYPQLPCLIMLKFVFAEVILFVIELQSFKRCLEKCSFQHADKFFFPPFSFRAKAYGKELALLEANSFL